MEDDVGLFCFVFIVAQDSLEKVICLIPMSVTTELLLQKRGPDLPPGTGVWTRHPRGKGAHGES